MANAAPVVPKAMRLSANNNLSVGIRVQSGGRGLAPETSTQNNPARTVLLAVKCGSSAAERGRSVLKDVRPIGVLAALGVDVGTERINLEAFRARVLDQPAH